MPTARRTSLTYCLLLTPQIAEKGRDSEMGKSGELSAQIQEAGPKHEQISHLQEQLT
jgi:hypothetical protein